MSLCLVTGGTGFLGSHLAEELVKKGHQVRCLVRNTSRLDWLLDTGVEFVFGDIQDKESVKKTLIDYEYIFHTAGLIKASDPELFSKVNFGGTQNLLELARENRLPLKRFVYVSSLAASGPSLNGRLKKETDPCNPVSIYGESKLAGEKALFEFAEKFPVTSIRPPAIYGPRDRQLLSLFKVARFGIIPILGEGDYQFSLIYVTDLVDGIIQAAFSPKAAGQIYFMADGGSYSWLEAGRILAEVQDKQFRRLVIPKSLLTGLAWLSEMTGKISGNSPYLTRRKLKELDFKMWVCDIGKARKELGFQPVYDFKSGAQKTIAWYRQNKWI